MSKYQYYEFVAIDEPLTPKQMAELRSRSSRASITSTSFIKASAALWSEPTLTSDLMSLKCRIRNCVNADADIRLTAAPPAIGNLAHHQKQLSPGHRSDLEYGQLKRGRDHGDAARDAWNCSASRFAHRASLWPRPCAALPDQTSPHRRTVFARRRHRPHGALRRTATDRLIGKPVRRGQQAGGRRSDRHRSRRQIGAGRLHVGDGLLQLLGEPRALQTELRSGRGHHA